MWIKITSQPYSLACRSSKIGIIEFMYKVKPKDIIPTRTRDEVMELQNNNGGPVGPRPELRENAEQELAKFHRLAQKAEKLNNTQLMNLMRTAMNVVDLGSTPGVSSYSGWPGVVECS